MFSAWLFSNSLPRARVSGSCSRTPDRPDSCGKRSANAGVRPHFRLENEKAGGASWGESPARRFYVNAMIAAACLLGAAAATAGGHQHLESWYTKALAEVLSARSEVRMKNGTRCDVFATDFAIEVEFAPKWCESIGQSLNYASQSGRRGAIALILESDSDERFLKRLREVISWHQLPIAVIVLRPFHESGLTLEFPEGMRAPAVPDLLTPVEAMDFLSQPNKWDRSESRPYLQK